MQRERSDIAMTIGRREDGGIPFVPSDQWLEKLLMIEDRGQTGNRHVPSSPDGDLFPYIRTTFSLVSVQRRMPCSTRVIWIVQFLSVRSALI